MTDTVLVTGAAGFIGFHTCQKLLSEGFGVIGIDDLNNYYDPSLKRDRIRQLRRHENGHLNFRFDELHLGGLESPKELADVAWACGSEITHVIHLASQAGVRYSLQNPHIYEECNVRGMIDVLEFCRNLPNLQRIVYASSSSVYGDNPNYAFAEDDVLRPQSPYAATKVAQEALGRAWSDVYFRRRDIPVVGLRFFTVYGPWGRPDMAYYSFSKMILDGASSIPLFAPTQQWRDFTYIDDIVGGIMGALTRPGILDHRIYNLGNSKPVLLMNFANLLVKKIRNRRGEVELNVDVSPQQLGDVERTCADTTRATEELGFSSSVDLEVGLDKFLDWYMDYRLRP